MHLVTGGSGYFGETMVRKLLEKGFDVRIFDLNPTFASFSKDVDCVLGDIRDPSILKKACQGVTHIYHNVAQVPLAKNANLFKSVNQYGTQCLLEAALMNEVHKVVYTSSSAIYGIPEKNPVIESTPAKPREKYGQAKLEGENICRRYQEKGMDISIIRPRTIIGHGRLGIFQILFEWIYQGWNIPILNGGKNVYQFIHADDLASASILAALSPGSDEFNIGASEFFSMAETLQSLIEHAKTSSKLRSVPSVVVKQLLQLTSMLRLTPLAPYHWLMYGESFYFNSDKAQRKLGWVPRFNNKEMFYEAYDWYKLNRNSIFMTDNSSLHRSAIKQGMLKLVKYLP